MLLFAGAPLSLGKSPTKDIQLLGPTVSRTHLRLIPTPTDWRILDCKSTNGVWVNGERVTQRDLRDGDRIRVGEFELTYRGSSRTDDFVPLPEAEIDESIRRARGRPEETPLRQSNPSAMICPCCGEAMVGGAEVCVQCARDPRSDWGLLKSVRQTLDVRDQRVSIVRLIPAVLVRLVPLSLLMAAPFVLRAAGGDPNPGAVFNHPFGSFSVSWAWLSSIFYFCVGGGAVLSLLTRLYKPFRYFMTLVAVCISVSCSFSFRYRFPIQLTDFVVPVVVAFVLFLNPLWLFKRWAWDQDFELYLSRLGVAVLYGLSILALGSLVLYARTGLEWVLIFPPLVAFLLFLFIYFSYVLSPLVGGNLWRDFFREEEPVPFADSPHCRTCGYNLTGLTSNRCPECGTSFIKQR